MGYINFAFANTSLIMPLMWRKMKTFDCKYLFVCEHMLLLRIYAQSSFKSSNAEQLWLDAT